MENNTKFFNKNNKINRFKRDNDNVDKNINDSYKNFVPEKYKKFSEKQEKTTPLNKKILKFVPNFLLSLSILAKKNKEVIKPMVEAFIN